MAARNLFCRVLLDQCTAWNWYGRSLRQNVPSSNSLVLARSKTKKAKKQKKSKKDLQREMRKEQLKKLEAEKAYHEALMKVARRGEPLDPEMLNPIRKRPPPKISAEDAEKRHLLVKEWTRYTMEQQKQEHVRLRGMVESRKKALRELRRLSLPLYLQATQLRTDVLPFVRTGPAHTPPIADYQPPENADY